ncbi:MAG: hypothetical protein ACE5H8_00715, partial [Alphaproteobacteria bacterium]
MSGIIVGIHGLANKPPKTRLTGFWRQSIAEGLEKSCRISHPRFDFRMVYWADLLYKTQQHDDPLFDFDRLYDREPYTPGPAKLKTYDQGFLDIIRADVSALAGAAADYAKRQFGMDAVADWIIRKTLRDLAFYYDDERKIGDRSKPKRKVRARKVLQDELRNALKPLKGERIMLIAHSMGSIIAYDVLRDIGREDPSFEVAHFATIGSPLGLPHVKAKIIEERAYAGTKRKRVRTPTVVTGRWVNYADRRDPVALDTHLRDDYGPNAHGV